MRSRKLSFWSALCGALLLILLMNSVCLGFSIDTRAAILMEPNSGRVLFAQNEHKRLPPASVTKVMTMLLIMEAVDSKRVKWEEMIPTSANAAKMGGSQVFLKEGEEFSLREMFKVIAVVSANDASAAVAEYLYGSITDFIDAMNQRAQALGLKDTHFANETGLPDPTHYSSAYDLAVISRELLKYPEVLKFTSIWMDSFRGGKFILRNTNELIRKYRGADGLKTGHTDEAKFCLSGTAKKGGFRLLSVILGADTDSRRVAETKRLLDYGFRTFQWKVVKSAKETAGMVFIKDASPQSVPAVLKTDFGVVVERGTDQLIETKLIPSRNLKFPIPVGAKIGEYRATLQGRIIADTDVYSAVKVKKANFLVRWWRACWDFIGRLFHRKK